jgi:hypothetical protein
MTAERKPSEIADELDALLATWKARQTDTNYFTVACRMFEYRDAIMAALRSAAPPRDEPVAQHAHDFDCVTAIFNQMKDACAEGISHEDGWILMPRDASPSAGRDAEDARRWRFMRNLLAVEDVERLVDDMRGSHPSETESAKADAAVDAAIAAEREGSRG